MPPPDTDTTRTLTLLLVRHGETVWNREGRLQGWQNVPLSPVGLEQAHLLAARLAFAWQKSKASFLPGPPCAFYASDLSRAEETARIVAQSLALVTGDAPLTVHSLPGLRERHFGEREGFTANEAQAKWGSAANHHETGETYAQVNGRMEAVLRDLWEKHVAPKEKGKTVFVAGHGGSLRLWLCRAAGLGPNNVRRFQLDNTSLSVVTFTGPTFEQGEGRILLCNDTAHLQTE